MSLTQLDEKAALIVIDLQKGLTAFVEAQRLGNVVESSSQLARAFRARGLPVVLVNVAAGAPGRTEIKRARPSLLADWADLVAELGQEPSDVVVTKRSPGAFIGTDLHDVLQQRSVSQIFLTGVATSNGVVATARSGYDFGYNVAFVTDAMMDADDDAHEYCLRKIFPKIGETVTTRELLDELHPL